MTYDVKIVIHVHCYATLDFGLKSVTIGPSLILLSVRSDSISKIVGPTFGPDRDRDRTEVVHR